MTPVFRPRGPRTLLAVVLCAASVATTLAACRARRPPPPALLDAPVFTLDPAISTYERDNRHLWMQMHVTVANPTGAPVRVEWAALKAAADAPLAGPTWQGGVLPAELGPGERVTAPVSWYAVGEKRHRPATVRVTYAPTGFARDVPVHVLPTSGFAYRVTLPATTLLAANPPPATGQSWEVRVTIEVRNPTASPLMLVPFWFEAVAGDQRVRHAGDAPPPLNAITRLGPGQSLRGSLLFRLRGTGPAPERVRVVFPADARPELDQMIEVRPASP